MRVVPYGANIDCNRNFDDIKIIVDSRATETCKLLFMGLDWVRKGGDIALKVAEELNKRGLSTQLTVVGCQPIIKGPLPNFVKPVGFISKSTEEGRQQIDKLLAESHFLILPTRAECFGLVFCEANSFGVPCLSTNVGGIPVRDGSNGKTFSLEAGIAEYCSYISDMWSSYSQYKMLAYSSFEEYTSRLNWTVAGQTMKRLLLNLRP